MRVPARLLALRHLEDQLGLGRVVGRLQRVPRYHVLVLAALHALDREDRLGPLGRHLRLVGVQALLEVVGIRDAHGRAWLEGRDVARRPPPVGGGDDGLAYLVPQLRVALHARAEDLHRAAPLLVDRERGVGPRVHDLRRLADVLRPLLERLALGLEQPPQRAAPDLVRPLDRPRLVGRVGRDLHELDVVRQLVLELLAELAAVVRLQRHALGQRVVAVALLDLPQDGLEGIHGVRRLAQRDHGHGPRKLREQVHDVEHARVLAALGPYEGDAVGLHAAERHQFGRSRHPHLGLGLHGGVAHELRDLLLQVVRAQVAEGDPAAAVVLGHELALLVRVVQRLPQRAQPDARPKLAVEQVVQEVLLVLRQPALPLIDRGGGVEPPAAAVVLRRLLPGDPAVRHGLALLARFGARVHALALLRAAALELLPERRDPRVETDSLERRLHRAVLATAAAPQLARHLRQHILLHVRRHAADGGHQYLWW